GGKTKVFRLRTGAGKKERTRYASARGVIRRVMSFTAAASRLWWRGVAASVLVRQCWLSMEITGRCLRWPAWQVKGSKSVIAISIFQSSTNCSSFDELLAALGALMRFLATVRL